jgi:hypothetical protein
LKATKASLALAGQGEGRDAEAARASEVKSPGDSDIIDNPASEVEVVDSSMLLLDSASVHLTNMEQTARKERHRGQVVARSYEMDALKRVLKHQLTQIKGRVEQDCVYPKRSEKRNFRFGKRDIIHRQLVDDVRQRRKYRKSIMAAESTIHNEQTANA